MTQNTTSVVPPGAESSTVVFDIHAEMAGLAGVLTPLLKRRLHKGLKSVQTDLKVYAETGEAVATGDPG